MYSKIKTVPEYYKKDIIITRKGKKTQDIIFSKNIK
jgi:hypothetical protein